jgi:hypothetical protein
MGPTSGETGSQGVWVGRKPRGGAEAACALLNGRRVVNCAQPRCQSAPIKTSAQ